MLIAKRSKTGGTPYQLRNMLMPLNRGGEFAGLGVARLGVDWWLGARIGAFIIMGIDLGKDVYSAITGAAQQAGVKPGDLSSGNISDMAKQIANSGVDPQGRSAAQWEALLTSQLGTGAAPLPVAPIGTCPMGYYRDPATGACIPLQKAGFLEDMSTGGWIALGAGALVLAKVLKLI